MKHKFQAFLGIVALSFALLLFPLATNSFAWFGDYTVNEIGDRQYIAKVLTRDNGDVHALGVGCTEGLFEIKIVSDTGPLDERDIRVRFDSKKVSYWSVSEGPSSNGLSSLEFSDPEKLFSLIKKAKTMAVQFYTYSGAAITTKFSVKGTSGIISKLKKAGCTP